MRKVKTAFYDLGIAPMSHDFVVFALLAKRAGCERVVFVPGNLKRTQERYAPEEIEQRLNSMLVPIARCAGLVPVVAASKLKAQEFWNMQCFPDGHTMEAPYVSHHMGMLTNAMPIGNGFAAGPIAMERMAQYAGFVSITIREQGFQKLRDSNIEQWLAAARKISERGYKVVFVPDSKRPERAFDGFPSCVEAAMDSEKRIALMSICAMNLSVCSGPISMAFYSDMPCIVFKPLVHEYWNTSPRFWEKVGIPVNSQPRWFNKNQRFVWRDDTAGNILRAFDEWRSVALEAAA